MLYDRMRVYSQNVVVQIFRDHWRAFKEFHPDLVTEYVEENVRKMMGCGLEKNGYSQYFCSRCGEEKVVAFSCKSRFCLRCTKVYVDNWLNRMRGTLFTRIAHRHVILTVPGVLWEYFHEGRMLKVLVECGAEMMKEMMTVANRGIEIEPGLILVVHTAGRASTWNPHLHLLITEGGLDKAGRWHDVYYIDYTILRKKWMYHLLKRVREEFKGDKRVEELIDQLWRKRGERGLIARAKKEKVRRRDIVGYLVKYVASPPIALSRITGYDGYDVSYWYREHPTDRKVEIRVSAFEFINLMIQHIPPKGFKMIRHYGLYGRAKVSQVREVLARIFEGVRGVAQDFRGLFWQAVAPESYRERVRESFGRDPLKCPRCGEEMTLFSIWHPRYGKIFDIGEYAVSIEEEIRRGDEKVARVEERREEGKQITLWGETCLSPL
jgi:hypothetical protein